MATSYLIGYDLKNKKEGAYENLFAAIEKLGSTWHDLDSTWLVLSNLTANDVSNQLNKHLGQGDKLLVLPVRVPGACYGLSNQSASSLEALLQQDPNNKPR